MKSYEKNIVHAPPVAPAVEGGFLQVQRYRDLPSSRFDQDSGKIVLSWQRQEALRANRPFYGDSPAQTKSKFIEFEERVALVESQKREAARQRIEHAGTPDETSGQIGKLALVPPPSDSEVVAA